MRRWNPAVCPQMLTQLSSHADGVLTSGWTGSSAATCNLWSINALKTSDKTPYLNPVLIRTQGWCKQIIEICSREPVYVFILTFPAHLLRLCYGITVQCILNSGDMVLILKECQLHYSHQKYTLLLITSYSNQFIKRVLKNWYGNISPYLFLWYLYCIVKSLLKPSPKVQ